MINKKVSEILDILVDMEYGFKDESGNNIIKKDKRKYDEEFSNFYYLQTPDELLNTKCGVCWDFVELERKLFSERNIKFETYWICIYDKDMLPSHTFLVYEENNKYYWFEYSWGKYRGIHEYKSKKELLLDVKRLFLAEHSYTDKDANLFVYKYNKPKFHISCDEFYKYIDTQEIVKLNTPLYFYHIVDNKADVSHGLISLKYMYDNNMYDLLDKNLLKYNQRVTNDWNIEKYKGKENITREEYFDALEIIRGKEAANYIYFFRYPLYKNLGNKVKELSKYKDMYRININDEELQKLILDVFYGYEMSYSDNSLLDKKYYEDISKEEYFSKYDDDINMNFSTLNHIGISFKNGYCPKKFLKKVEWKDSLN